MFSKIFGFALVIFYVQAVPIGHGVATSYAQVNQHVTPHKQLIQDTLPIALGHQSIDYHGYPQYTFKYGVQDTTTGDIKQQEETRDGDVVKGSYSLHEPDGTILSVHYTADKYSGFNAQVLRSGHAIHPQQY